MRALTFLMYEVTLSEINALPPGFAVLQVNTEHKTKRVLQAHIDFFSANFQVNKYFLFEAPPLPKLQVHEGVK